VCSSHRLDGKTEADWRREVDAGNKRERGGVVTRTLANFSGQGVRAACGSEEGPGINKQLGLRRSWRRARVGQSHYRNLYITKEKGGVGVGGARFLLFRRRRDDGSEVKVLKETGHPKTHRLPRWWERAGQAGGGGRSQEGGERAASLTHKRGNKEWFRGRGKEHKVSPASVSQDQCCAGDSLVLSGTG